MSHTTTLKGLQIRDIGAVRAAVAELQSAGVKVSLLENAQPRMYYGNQHGVCAFVLQLPGRYDVGLDLQADGTYAPVYDEWDRDVARTMGATCPMPNTPEGRAQHGIGKFLQSYAKHAAMNSAIAQGYMVEAVTTDASGAVHLTLAGM